MVVLDVHLDGFIGIAKVNQAAVFHKGRSAAIFFYYIHAMAYQDHGFTFYPA